MSKIEEIVERIAEDRTFYSPKDIRRYGIAVAKAVAQEVYNIGGCRVMPRSTMLGVCHDGSPCPCGNCAKIRALLGKDGE